MKKSIHDEDVFYTIVWSRLIPYDKYSASRILPEMAGIICILEKIPNGDPVPLIFYGCWRDGLRMGLKNFMDPDFSKQKDIAKSIQPRKILYKYTVVDSSPLDMQDVMYWLIKSYESEFNALEDFQDSRRYQNIHVKEMIMKDDQVIENIPKFGL